MGHLHANISQRKNSASSFTHAHYHCQGIKMMFNGLPVLSAVLVCSSVFFGYVVGDECEDVLHEVESVKTCIRDVIFYLELADISCSDSLVDRLTHEKITAAIDERVCPEVGDECEDIFYYVEENVRTCIRDVDFYL